MTNTYADAANAVAVEAKEGFEAQQPDMYVDPDVFSKELQKHITAIYTLFNDALGEPVQDERFQDHDLPMALNRVMQAFGPAQTSFRGKGVLTAMTKAGKSSEYYRKQAVDEIGCEKLEQHNRYRRGLQQEAAVWGVAHQAAKQVYEDLVGSEYVPYVKPNSDVRHLNSATHEAEQLAAKDKELKTAFG